MKHSKGYMVVVRTSTMKNGSIYKTGQILDNKVWQNFDNACHRIHSIAGNKCNKHNYRIMYDNLTLQRKDRMKSDIKLAIERHNFNVVKQYIVKPMQIDLES